MFSLIHNSKSDSYEIREKCKKLSSDEEILHSSKNINILKDFKYNIESGLPIVRVRLMNNEAQQIETASQKKHCCVFCRKQYFKIHRHYETVHKNENEVKDSALLPKKDPNRLKMLNNLRKRGNYLCNTTKDDNEPNIICHKSKGEAVCCPNCKGFYSEYSLRHHLSRCDPTIYVKQEKTTIQPEAKKMMIKLHCNASKDLREKIFPYMREDDVVKIIRYDDVVIQYGNYSCRTYTSEHHAARIRSNLRAFGKLLLRAKEMNPNIDNMNDLLNANNVDLIIEAIKKIAGFNEKTGLYSSPATAMTLKRELKKLNSLLLMEFIETSDKDNLERMEDFLTVFDFEFEYININKNGGKSKRVAWCEEEIELVKKAFRREIDLNQQISSSQVKEFYNKNKETMRRRTPHLILQWIKGEQKRNQRIIANMKPNKERYTKEEQAVLEETFLSHIKEEETQPSLAEFLVEQNEILNSRLPAPIETFIYNGIETRITI